MKIGRKLTLGFLTVVLLIWAVGYFAVNASQKALQESIGESSVSLAVEVLSEIDRSIYNRIEEFQVYSKDLESQEAVTKSNQEFEKLDDIQSYINEKDKEWTSVPEEEITPFMQELVNSKLSEELREKAKFYEERHGHKIFGEIFTTNKYGANVAQTGRTTDYRQDDEEWWQRAKKDGLYVADVEYDRSAKVYSTDIGIRIDGENGNFIGVIKVVLSIEEVIDIIKKAEATIKYDTTQFKLLTKDGEIIYATEGSEFLKSLPEELAFLLHKGSDHHHHMSHFIAAGDKLGERKELFAHAHSKGYGDYKGLGWTLIIEHETEEIFAPVAQLRTRILIITLAITAFAIVLGLFISKSISNPVSKLAIAAVEIGKGNLDTRIEIKSKDEIGKLAASFNDMTGKLKESYAHLKESHTHLEEEVQERTTELSLTNVKLKEKIGERSSAQRTLNERIKELSCLFSLSKLVEQPDISLEQIFQETVHLVRNVYQYPDVTCAKITFEGIQYKTDNFEKSELSQYARINVRGDEAGAIEVYYLGEKPESGQDPFLKEESDLLNAVAKHLGRVAERSQAKEKLQLFRNLMGRSNDSIFVTEPQWGRFLDVNEKACDYLGYTREELLNMTVKDIDDSILDDSCWTERAKEIRKEEYMIFESVYKRKDGTTFPVEINVAFIKQEKKGYLLAIVRDITERKQAEEMLRAEQQRLYSLLDGLPAFVYLQAPDHSVRFANRHFREQFGEPEGKMCYEVLWGAKEPCKPCPTFRVFDTKEPQVWEWSQSPDGRIYEINDYPFSDVDGSPLVLEMGIDITDRRIIEAALKESEEKYRKQFEEAMDAIFIADAKTGVIIDCNDAAAELVGRERTELVGKHQRILHPPEEIEGEFSRTFKQHLGEQEGEALETKIITKNGEIRDAAIKANLLEVKGRKLIQGIFRDITERKQAQQRQDELLEDIESINKELKDFAYIISHDLKAPLRGIKTLVNWITTDYADKLDEEGGEQMNLLSIRVDRMHNLIEGVLQYSRVGRVKEEKTNVNLNELVPEVIDTVAPPENIAVTVEDKLPVVEGEETRIIQVFQNLLSNAVKYMDKPKGQIKVGCVEDDDFWKFTVADNGPGIEEKHFERIFQMFQTLSPRDEFESTGVGLTVVKKIVELYGGKVWVESKPGEGSTFFFTLPKQKMGIKDAKYEANIVS